MSSGKRPRHPMRRTTSMTGFAVDLPNMDSSEPSDQITESQEMMMMIRDHTPEQSSLSYYNNSDGHHRRFLATLVSPRVIQGKSSADFLTTCGLCHRRLAAGKDIYMYRGDTAFCSVECREKQIKDDERREKRSVVIGSKKDDVHLSSSSSSKTTSSSSSSSSRKAETVGAA